MHGATLTYNGVTLALVKTNMINGQIVMTDDGVDYLYTRYTINVSGILNPQETSYSVGPVPIPNPGELPVDTYAAIRHAIMQPRGQLSFTNANRFIFLSPQNGYIVDVDNGPKPQSFNVTRIDGGKLWHVTYQIDVAVIECPTISSAMLSNRFSQSQTINDTFHTISTTSGVAYFRTDILAQTNLVADTFRTILLPPVPRGFARESMKFGVNTKGNAIEYEVVDVERDYDLGDTGATGSGSFITKADGYYNLSTINQTNKEGLSVPSNMALATMNVKLEGTKQADNWNLCQTAFQIMSTVMPISEPLIGTVYQISITQGITRRYVDVTLVMRLNSVTNGPFGGIRVSGLQKNSLIFPDFGGNNPQPPQGKMTRGTASLTLLSSALKQACLPQTAPDFLPPGAGVTPPNIAGPAPLIKVYPTDLIPPTPNRIKPPSTQYPYTRSQIDSYYDTKNGNYQTPISGTYSSSGSGSTGGGTTDPSTDQSCSIVTLHRPLTKRIVNWVVERIGSIPQVPAFNSNNGILTLLDYDINTAEVTLLPDGVTPCYQVSGKYIYALKNSIDKYDKITLDIPQWIDYPYGQQALQMPPPGSQNGGNFSNGIIQ